MAKRPSQMPKDLDTFLNKVVSGTIKKTQEELGSRAISPWDTGRLRSSWFANEGTASTAVAPEGTDSPNTDAAGLKVDWRREYHLTNNLPYAESACVEGKVTSKATTWFHDFLNSRVPKIIDSSVKEANN
jgi:hypothetical protein